MKLRLHVPLSIVLLFILLFMGLVPLLLLQTVISQQARATVEGQVVKLTQGILESARGDFNHRLYDLQQAVHPEKGLGLGKSLLGLLRLRNNDPFDLSSIDFPEEMGEVLMVPFRAGGKGVRVFRQKTQVASDPAWGVQWLSGQDLRRSDTLEIIRENPLKVMVLGQVPQFPNLPQGVWAAGTFEAAGEQYLLALAMDRVWLVDFIAMLSKVTDSTVNIVTADNVVLPDDKSGFFEKPWSSQALGRTKLGQFLSFAERDPGAREGPSDVLVNVFADPDFLYNLVVVTTGANLLGPFQGVIDLSGLIITLSALVFSVVSLLLVFAMNRRFRVIKSQLESANGQLEAKVQERTGALEKSLSSLISAQDMLVQNEKMATLGRATAAFTHEINTPLGVSNMAASQMSQVLGELEVSFGENTLSKQHFLATMANLREGAAIIERNMQQASGITASFKHVATDQGSDRLRDFELGAYVREIVLSLSPRLRHSPYRLDVHCPTEIRMFGNPAVFYQILSNLINNSIAHGFEGRASGCMSVDVEPLADKRVRLSYRDDGQGLSEEALTHLFEPYFTTKSGRGGSGLGTSIIHSLVTEVLHGSIVAESHPGQGLRYVIEFPTGAA